MDDGAPRLEPAASARSTSENPLFEWDGAAPASGPGSASAASAQSWLAQQGRGASDDPQLPPPGEAVAYDTHGDSSCSASEAGSAPGSPREAERKLASAPGAEEGGPRRSRSASPLEGGTPWGGSTLRAAYGVRAASAPGAEPSPRTAEDAAAEPAAAACVNAPDEVTAASAAAELVPAPAARDGGAKTLERDQKDGHKTLGRRQKEGPQQHGLRQRSASTHPKHAAARKATEQQGRKRASQGSGLSTRLWLTALLLLAALLTGGYLLALYRPADAPKGITPRVPDTIHSTTAPAEEVGSAAAQPAAFAHHMPAVSEALDPAPAPATPLAHCKPADSVTQLSQPPQLPLSATAPEPAVVPKVRAKPAPGTAPRVAPAKPARSAPVTVRPEPAARPATAARIEPEAEPAASTAPGIRGTSIGASPQRSAGSQEPAAAASGWHVTPALAAAALAAVVLCGAAAALLRRRAPSTGESTPVRAPMPQSACSWSLVALTKH